MKLNKEPEPDNPQDPDSKQQNLSVFANSSWSDLIFGLLAIIVVQSSFIYAATQNLNEFFIQQIPKDSKIITYTNNRLKIAPLNSIIIKILQFFIRIPIEAFVILLSTAYTFISTYLFRKVLQILKLSKYSNALTLVFMIFPTIRITYHTNASRDVLFLCFILYSIILFHQSRFILLNFTLFLASTTVTEGLLLYISAALAISIMNPLKSIILAIQIYPVYLLQINIGLRTLLLPKLFEILDFYIKRIITVRETNAILEMIIIAILGVLGLFFVSKYAFFVGMSLLFVSICSPTSFGAERLLSLTITLGLIGFAKFISPRMKFAIYIGFILYFIPTVFFTSIQLYHWPSPADPFVKPNF